MFEAPNHLSMIQQFGVMSSPGTQMVAPYGQGWHAAGGGYVDSAYAIVENQIVAKRITAITIPPDPFTVGNRFHTQVA